MATPLKVARGQPGADDEDDDAPQTEQLELRRANPKSDDPDVATVGGLDNDDSIEIDDKEDWDPATKIERSRGGPARRTRDQDDDEPDERLAYSDDPEDDDDDAHSRRSRRNRARREAVRTSQAEIAGLRQELAQTQGLVHRLTQGQMGIHAGSLESQLRSAQQALQLTDDELADAVSKGDGARYKEVTKLRDEALNQVWSLTNERNRLLAQARQPNGMAAGGQPQRQQTQQELEAAEKARRYSEEFLDRHDWFDPKGTDRNSRMARAIDEEVGNEGYLPNTRAYWVELESRMAEAGLTQRRGRNDDDDGDDDAPPRRNGHVNGNGVRRYGPPTSAARGSRRAGGGRVFQLTGEMESYLEQEGLMERNLSKEQQARKVKITTAWRDGMKSLRR